MQGRIPITLSLRRKANSVFKPTLFGASCTIESTEKVFQVRAAGAKSHSLSVESPTPIGPKSNQDANAKLQSCYVGPPDT